jgi:exopolysaccharide biosynthesis polyprenyl glycosylphosphotransferase
VRNDNRVRGGSKVSGVDQRSHVEISHDLVPRIAEPTLSLWRTAHLTRLVILDGLVIWIALTTAAYSRRGVTSLSVAASGDINYGLLVFATAAFWLLALSARGAYESRFYGTGPEEYKRVISATLVTFGTVAVTSYAFKLQLPRSFVAVSLPMGLGLLLLGRYIARRWLIKRRIKGLSLHRVVAVGDEESVENLRAQLAREQHAGYDVVGSCRSDGDVIAALRASRADTLAVTASRDMTSQRLREISWGLEGTNVALIVAPSLTDVAGPRITVHPVGGLPLLHVDEPRFTGWRRFLKGGIDRTGAAIGLVLLSPVLLGAALAIRLTSPGPAVFRQRRTGVNGQDFLVFKFRTMYRDAEARLAELQGENQSDGLLFKIKDDPRITRVGAFLRRASIDELPQLINVITGDMSLVGPRPLPVEDAEFQGHVRRRMLVRPGITGLWQVSGRSDMLWEDAVRLDLYYVENWSITLDLMILARTVSTVLRGGGAY